MIDMVYGKYELSCDVCGDITNERLDNFQDAIDYKKSNGWKSQNFGGVWQDVCPDCQ